MSEPVRYKYLQPKRGSRYQQLAVNGRIRAEVLFRETIGQEPLTAEEVAREYDLPVQAVLEAIDYCVKNRELLDEERDREEAWIRATSHDKWPYAPRRSEPDDRQRYRTAAPGQPPTTTALSRSPRAAAVPGMARSTIRWRSPPISTD